MRMRFIIGAILLVAVGLLVLALIHLNNLLADNKEQIVSQVEQALGREVAVQEIGVTLWGGIGARLTQFRLADDPAFSADAFVQADDLQVNIALWPLLFREIRVDRLILRGPRIRLIRNEQGRFNFTSLTHATTADAERETPPEGDGTASSPLLFLVALVDIQDGDIRYSDRQAGTDFQITQLDLRARDVGLDEPVRLELDAAVLSDQQNIRLDVQAGPVGQGLDDVSAIPLEGRVTIRQLDMNVLQQALPDMARHIPPGLGLSGPLSLETVVSGRAGALHLSDTDLQAAVFDSGTSNIRLTGSFGPLGAGVPDPLAESTLDGAVTLGPLALERVRQFGPVGASLPPDLDLEGPVSVTVQARGQPNNLTLTGQVEATDSTLRFGTFFNKPPGSVFALSAQAQLTPQAAVLQELALTLHTLVLTLSGNVGFDTVPDLDLTADSNRVELAELYDFLPLLRDVSAAGHFETHLRVAGPFTTDGPPGLTGTLSLRDGRAAPTQMSQPVTDIQATVTLMGQGAELTEATARIGQSTLRLKAQVEQLEPLQAVYELHAPALRLADLHAASPEDRLEAVSATGRIWSQGGDLHHAGRLSSEQGRVAQARYTDLQIDSSLAGQVARIDAFSLRAFEGRLDGSGQYDLGAERPHLAVAAQVEDLDLAELFRSVLALTDPPVQGTAALDFAVSGSGHTWDALKPTLRGQGRAEITDGVLREVNLAEGVLAGLAGIPGLSLVLPPQLREKYPKIFASPHTEFDDCAGQLSLGEGRITLDRLHIAARDFRTQATGWMDFEQQVHATASLTLSEALSADLVRATRELRYIANAENRVEVPFALAGVFPDVSPTLNAQQISGLLKRAASHALQDMVQEKILDTLRPSKKKQQGEAVQQPNDRPAAEPPEQQMIQRGLDALFGR